MKPQLAFPTRLDEIVFARRNKSYGAYSLRSSYLLTLFKALLFPLLCLALCALLLAFRAPASVTEKAKGLIDPDKGLDKTVEVDLRPEKKPKALSPLPENKAAKQTQKQEALIIKEDSAVTEESVFSLNTGKQSEGKSGADLNGKSEGGDSLSAGQGVKPPSEPVFVPDEMPEFEGGLPALYAFISKHIRYPVEAREAFIQNKVNVRFIVDEEGKVILPQALNRPGYGLDHEAERVVALLPPFKRPAKLAGQAVKCYFVLPISFKMH